jgi:putative transposase
VQQRRWSIKYEQIYLGAYASVSGAFAETGWHLFIYNSLRPHSSHDGKTPDGAFFNQPMPEAVAA